MYKFIKIRHDIPLQYHGDYMVMKKFIICLRMKFLRNSSQETLGVLRGAFYGFGCPKGIGVIIGRKFGPHDIAFLVCDGSSSLIVTW